MTGINPNYFSLQTAMMLPVTGCISSFLFAEIEIEKQKTQKLVEEIEQEKKKSKELEKRISKILVKNKGKIKENGLGGTSTQSLQSLLPKSNIKKCKKNKRLE